MTPEQIQAVKDLRAAGYVVVIWEPDEVEGVDTSGLEAIVIECGNEFIDLGY